MALPFFGGCYESVTYPFFNSLSFPFPLLTQLSCSHYFLPWQLSFSPKEPFYLWCFPSPPPPPRYPRGLKITNLTMYFSCRGRFPLMGRIMPEVFSASPPALHSRPSLSNPCPGLPFLNMFTSRWNFHHNLSSDWMPNSLLSSRSPTQQHHAWLTANAQNSNSSSSCLLSCVPTAFCLWPDTTLNHSCSLTCLPRQTETRIQVFLTTSLPGIRSSILQSLAKVSGINKDFGRQVVQPNYANTGPGFPGPHSGGTWAVWF